MRRIGHYISSAESLAQLIRSFCCILILTFPNLRAGSAEAETIETDLTSHQIVVDINFSGASITLFGTTVEKSGPDGRDRPDVVITVEGPAQTINLQKKSRVAGIWLNTEKQTFDNAPAYLALLSNRPLEEITTSENLLKLGIGFNSLAQELVAQNLRSGSIDGQAFSENFIRLMEKQSRFHKDTKGVTFVGEHLFRAKFKIPADVPTGNYLAEIHLFRQGILQGVANSTFNVHKAGIEQLIYSTAHEMPFLYGILSVILAIVAGLGASYIFRNR